jgi:hypothetical protein
MFDNQGMYMFNLLTAEYNNMSSSISCYYILLIHARYAWALKYSGKYKTLKTEWELISDRLSSNIYSETKPVSKSMFHR